MAMQRGGGRGHGLYLLKALPGVQAVKQQADVCLTQTYFSVKSMLTLPGAARGLSCITPALPPPAA